MRGLTNPDPSFWTGKRVLVTGHTGFKGAWLSIWLARLGANVVGISLPPATTPNLYDLAQAGSHMQSHLLDIRDARGLADRVRAAAPHVVLHLAAQSLVRPSYHEPLETLATNVQSDDTRVVVAITTDKVYRNLEQQVPYRETDALGGHDPYSASKAAAEIVVACYRDAFLADRGIAVASARAGNVIGGGDWSADRLIPDAVRAWSTGKTLPIRRPQAVRPWQHVLEPLSGYLLLAERLWHTASLAGAYNFGPLTHEAATVRDVVDIARRAYGRGDVHWGDGTEGPHEAGWLALEIAKARHELGVMPRWDLKGSVERSMQWYTELARGVSAAELCARDIMAFEGEATLEAVT
jgi:CDP-glucose 4,6-dehydratase